MAGSKKGIVNMEGKKKKQNPLDELFLDGYSIHEVALKKEILESIKREKSFWYRTWGYIKDTATATLQKLLWISRKFYYFVVDRLEEIKEHTSQKVSIAFIPHTHRKVVTLSTSISTLVFGFVAFTTFTILAVYSIVNYGATRREVAKLKSLQKGTVQEYSMVLEEVTKMKKQVDELMPVLKSLQKQLGIKETSLEFEGVGGGEEELYGNLPPEYLEMKEITGDLVVTKQIISSLRRYIAERKKITEYTPTIWPTRGRITSTFGWRRDPFTGKRRFHGGVDIANWPGTPIYATASGVVKFAGWKGGYGIVVAIQHKYGYETVYAHLSREIVRVGQKIRKGQLIAYMGRTGRATGPHLHYEIRINGERINPLRYLLK